MLNNTILKGKQLIYILSKEGDTYHIYDKKGLVARTATSRIKGKKVITKHYDWNMEQINNLIKSLNLKVVNN